MYLVRIPNFKLTEIQPNFELANRQKKEMQIYVKAKRKTLRKYFFDQNNIYHEWKINYICL